MDSGLTTYGPLEVCLGTKPEVFVVRWKKRNIHENLNTESN
jgi:hypothetical protein